MSWTEKPFWMSDADWIIWQQVDTELARLQQACQESIEATRAACEKAIDVENIRCDTCKYESPEERHSSSEWWWERHCNLAEGRPKIDTEDHEGHPEWCPRVKRNG